MAPNVTQLTRRKVNKGYVELLTPSNVTNSKKSDGGWMDTRGIKAVGLGSMFSGRADPIDSYISNNAYAHAGFASMHVEVHGPLETIGKPSTRENLMEYLKSDTLKRENTPYKAGNFVDLNAPRIDNPADMGSTADLIVQYWYERACDAVGADLPPDLKAVVKVAILYFAGKGIVLLKADNFHNHVPTIDLPAILSSIRFIGKPYLPPTSVFGIPMQLGSIIDLQDDEDTQPVAPRLCFRCSASKSPEGRPLFRCSRCKWATYCCTDCQKADWKRHKKGECLSNQNTK